MIVSWAIKANSSGTDFVINTIHSKKRSTRTIDTERIPSVLGCWCENFCQDVEGMLRPTGLFYIIELLRFPNEQACVSHSVRYHLFGVTLGFLKKAIFHIEVRCLAIMCLQVLLKELLRFPKRPMHVCLLLVCCFKANVSCTRCSKITSVLRGWKKVCWMRWAIVLSGQSTV